MGDLTQVSCYTAGWDAWTGGRPKPSWVCVGLDDINGLDSPNELRLIDASSTQKGYNYQVKFDSKDDLQVFKKKVKALLVDCGMDSSLCYPARITQPRVRSSFFPFSSRVYLCASGAGEIAI
jgi:hypothetical protein